MAGESRKAHVRVVTPWELRSNWYDVWQGKVMVFEFHCV